MSLDCDALQSILDSLTNAIEELVNQLGGDNDAAIYDILQLLAAALRLLAKEAEECVNNGNGGGNGA